MENNLVSYEPIEINNWGIKISKCNGYIQVFVWNEILLSSHIEWFSNDLEAYQWIEYISSSYVQF
jgi:hypothetical protein